MTTTNEDEHDLAGVYALDALDPAEAREFERHMGHCDRCRRDVDDFHIVAAMLATTLEASPPMSMPAGIDELTSRRQGAAPPPPTSEHHRVHWLVSVAAAVVAALLVLGVAWNKNSAVRDIADPVPATTMMAAERDGVVLRDPHAVTIRLSNQGGATARLVWSTANGRAVLVTEALPTLQQHDVYELWFSDAGRMAPGPTFAGDSRVVGFVAPGATAPEKVSVTVEPSGGSRQPTGPTVFTGTAT